MRLLNLNFKGVILSAAKDPEGVHSPRSITASSYRSSRFSIGARILQLILLGALACTTLGAANSRFNDLGHKMMCTCGCAQVLLECNHMGCPDSPGLIADLHTHVDAGLGDRPILNYFAQKYGPTVLAAPMRGGFDIVAWVMPFAVLGLATIGVALLIRKWHIKSVAAPSTAVNAPFDAVRERIRKETEY